MSTLSNRDKATKLQASANSTGAAAAVGSEASKLSMALGVVSVDTWDKHDIQDIIFWMRAIISLVIGIVWGFIPITGMIGLTR